MASDELTLWKPNAPVTIPPDVDGAQIAAYARQLSARERQQIEYAFTSGSYEMGTSFLWKKAMDGLRRQLASLGMEFVGEMLDRSDITADSSIQHVVTDYEALTLAEELGMFNTTQTMRLRQAMEMVMRCRCVRPLAGLRRPESARSPLSSRCGLLTFRADLRQYVRVHDNYATLYVQVRKIQALAKGFRSSGTLCPSGPDAGLWALRSRPRWRPKDMEQPPDSKDERAWFLSRQPHVRFDEGGQETCDCVTRLCSTLPSSRLRRISAVMSTFGPAQKWAAARSSHPNWAVPHIDVVGDE